MRGKRLLWQLYPSYLILIIASLVAVTWYSSVAARNFYYEQTADALESRARVLDRYITSTRLTAADDLEAMCRDMKGLTDTRITVIRPSGVVVADSDTDPSSMENHSDRQEIIAALEGRVISDVRRSPTLGVPMMYAAIQTHDGRGNKLVVRTAVPLTEVNHVVRDLQIRIALMGLLMALIAAVVCLFVSRRIARPLEEMKRGVANLTHGDLSRRLHVPKSEEAGELAVAINELAEQSLERIQLVTAQRNEQEAVFSSMAEGVLAVNNEGKIIRVNHAACELLNVAQKEAEGKTVLELTRNMELHDFIARSLRSDSPVEEEIPFREKQDRRLQAHGTPMNNASGAKMGAVIVLNDVTRMRRLEDFRRDFVANVSHELRTPVTSIKGFAETLLEGAAKDPESAERFLQIIARQADRLNAIINDLLLLSRLEQQGDRIEIAMDQALILNVLDTAVEVCKPKAEAREMKIEVECEDGLLARISTPLLEQAVVNLIDNAIKYSETGKPVHVAAKREGGNITISVRDEGAGIEAEHLPRLFERFYRVDKGRSRDMGGTGLGLAIVKHIAQAHGGTVTVESVLGRGSTFTISFPAK